MSENKGFNGNAAQAKKVVDRILELAESGQPLPWVKPWNNGKSMVKVVDGVTTVTLPAVAVNRQGKAYQGINTYLPLGEYITFNQCHKEGGRVKKGAKGFPVVYWNFVKKTIVNDDGSTEEKTIPMLKGYTVFNVNDCDGIEQKHEPKSVTVEIPNVHYEPVDGAPADFNPIAESIISGYLARNPGFEFMPGTETDRAYYSPSFDHVKMPNRSQFADIAEYYSTAFHELGHSTGHSSRLNRFTGKAACAAFGSEEYSREELVAESTAATILNAIGLESGNSFRNSAAYIKSWASHIKNDPMMYVTAATRAQAAVNCLLGIDNQPETIAE